MNDRFTELRIFIRVAETGSFSRAGRELGLAQPSVSRSVAALEARLGVRLLARTTRRVAPTEAGLHLLEQSRALLAGMEAMEAGLRGDAGLAGVLRVATPVTFGARQIVPALPAFLAAHPALRVELLMADRRVDLLEEGVDLAIRLGDLPDSSFTSRTLARGPRGLVASPAYLAQHGAPRTPEALDGHAVVLARPSEEWALRDAAGMETVLRVPARLVASSVEGVLAAVQAGLGLAALSDFACAAELARGEVVRVLPGYRLPPVAVHAVLPAGRLAPAKARTFIDHLATAFRE